MPFLKFYAFVLAFSFCKVLFLGIKTNKSDLDKYSIATIFTVHFIFTYVVYLLLSYCGMDFVRLIKSFL